MCLHFSYPDSIRTRARRFLRCIPSQVCFEPLTRTRPPAECCECHQLKVPGVAYVLLLTENQAEYVRNQRQAYAALMVATVVQHAPAAAGATVFALGDSESGSESETASGNFSPGASA
jgi:hypothetical protein